MTTKQHRRSPSVPLRSFWQRKYEEDEEHADEDSVALYNLLEATTSYSAFITMMQGEGD